MKRRNTTHFENSKPTSQNAMKKKGKKKDEVTKLMEGQKSMGSFYYQTREGEKAIMTRSERRRRMTVDIKPQRPSTREAKNAPERKAKPKMNPLKIPTTVKPMQQESKKEVSLQNAIMQLEEGASKVSKENIQTKDCSHEILSFPECASFLKVNDKITFCKMSQNRGVVLMEGGAVRQWNMNEAGAFSVSQNPIGYLLFST